MADRFEPMRLSLVKRPQLPLLFHSDGQHEPEDRESYIRRVFGTDRQFSHYNAPFVYVQVAAPVERTNAVLIGRIGREYESIESLPPEQDLGDTKSTRWAAAIVVIDPTAHQDGQKVLVSREAKIGDPFSVFHSLVKSINEAELTAPYHIEVDPIFDPQTFWAFAEEHRGEITTLTFDFLTPNMFDTTESIEEELRDIRNNEHAETVTVEYRSSDGINTETKRIKEGVAYAQRGSGSIRAVTKSKKRYNSKRRRKGVALPKSPEPTVLGRVLANLKALIGR